MKTITSIFLIITLFTLNSASAQSFIQAYANIVNQTSQTNITTNLTEYEALGVKRKGTAELQNTLNWLKNKYLSYGYTNAQMVEDTYSYSGFTCKNLTLNKVGTVYPNIYVIICGHYDSISGTGTNDNGSGVVSILEMARLLKDVPTEYSIKFVNFSGEEDGLKGSQAYVTNVVNSTTPKLNIKLVFNLDEVGGVAGMVNNTITCERDTASPTSNNAASNTFTNQMITCVGLYTSLNTFLSYAYNSDYMSFQSNNEVITGMFETNETTHEHTPTDFLVNMDPVYNYNVAKAAIASTLHFAVASTALSNEEFNSDFQVSFFPNPTNEFLNINSGVLNEAYQISLIDVNGKIVLEKTIDNPNQIEKINVSLLQKGLYLAILKTKNQKITKKVVIN